MKKTLLAILIGATLMAPAAGFASTWQRPYLRGDRHAYYGGRYRYEGHRYRPYWNRRFREHDRRHGWYGHRRYHHYRDRRWGRNWRHGYDD